MDRCNDISYFVSWCVEQYKVAMHMEGEETMKLFDKYGVLDYLAENFEVLHTQGRQWLIDEINEYIDNRKREISGDMSIGEINQSNVHHLIPGKISWMVRYYMEDYQCSMLDALRYLYSTDVYKRLEDESTKAWNYGPAELYNEL